LAPRLSAPALLRADTETSNTMEIDVDLQKLSDVMGEQDRRTRGKYQMTLGGMIAELEKLPADAHISFSDGASPGEAMSYRGYYSDLSFEPEMGVETVGNFLARCKQSLGFTYEGYKGGDFTMAEDTPLWMASYGCCGEAIMAVTERDGAVVIDTKIVD
jgi:hypothetical protein